MGRFPMGGCRSRLHPRQQRLDLADPALDGFAVVGGGEVGDDMAEAQLD